MNKRTFEKEIERITASHGCTRYGYADLKGLTRGELANFHRGISYVIQMEPWVMEQLAPRAPRTSLKAGSFSRPSPIRPVWLQSYVENRHGCSPDRYV